MSEESPGEIVPTKTVGCCTINDHTKAQKASSGFCVCGTPD
jgi:hypothetical protein